MFTSLLIIYVNNRSGCIERRENKVLLETKFAEYCSYFELHFASVQTHYFLLKKNESFNLKFVCLLDYLLQSLNPIQSFCH